MEKCQNCGKSMNLQEEIYLFNLWCKEHNIDGNYYDFIDDGCMLCSDCAINYTLENLGAGAQYIDN